MLQNHKVGKQTSKNDGCPAGALVVTWIQLLEDPKSIPHGNFPTNPKIVVVMKKTLFLSTGFSIVGD